MIKVSGFAKMLDQDYPSRYDEVILFDYREKYVLSGKTHGLVSHALKHLIEFDEYFVKSILYKMKSKLKVEFLFFYKKNNTIRVLRKSDLTPGILLNTLDLINDKIENRETLYSDEKEMILILQSIKDEYRKICLNIQQNAIEIFDFDTKNEIQLKINRNKPIWFNVNYKSVDMQNCIDLKNKIYMSIYQEKIRTVFKMDSSFLYRQYGTDKTKIKNSFLEKIILEKI